jgi:hypothetical protein
VPRGADAVPKEALAETDGAGDADAVVVFALAVVGDAAIFQAEEILGHQGTAEHLGIFGVAKGLGDAPGLDTSLVVPLDVVDLGDFGRGGLNRVEKPVGSGDVFFIAVVGLGDVAEGVMLGEEATAVDVVAEHDDLAGGEGAEVAEEGGGSGGVDGGAVGIGNDDADEFATEAKAGGRWEELGDAAGYIVALEGFGEQDGLAARGGELFAESGVLALRLEERGLGAGSADGAAELTFCR